MFEDTGAVILADNTEQFDYVRLAAIAAKRVKKHLGIPVTLITSESVEPSLGFDSVIKADQPQFNKRVFKHGDKVDWKNLNRTLVYDLTPYYRTLVIDADFLVTSDALFGQVFNKQEFVIAKTMYDPATGHDYVKQLGKSKIDQLWATVMVFSKTPQVQKIFAMAQHVIDNYLYYSKLYNFNSFPIRNDYAFTIACHVIGGYGATDYSMRGYKMFNCDFYTALEELNEDNFLVSYKKTNKDITKTYIQRLKHTDVHFQDKESLFARLQ
jgi:hypothetical protein